MSKRERILLAVCGSIVILFLMSRVVCSPSQPERVGAKSQTTAVKTPHLSEGSPEEERKKPPVPPSWGRDPFEGLPQIAADDSVADQKFLVLKAISWKNDTAYVLINDVILREGETKEGISLLEVKGKQVLCRKGGRVFNLILGERIEGITR